MPVARREVRPPVALFECLLALQHHADVFVDDVLRLAFRLDAAVQKKNRPVRKLLHQAEIVRHEEHGRLLLPQFFEFPDAAVGENRVSHRQRFIHDQNLRIDMNRGGKCQTHIHAAGIFLHRALDEFSDFGEALDQGQVALHLRARDAHDLAVDKHILAPRKFRIETRAQFEQCGHSPSGYHSSRGRLQNAG